MTSPLPVKLQIWKATLRISSAFSGAKIQINFLLQQRHSVTFESRNSCPRLESVLKECVYFKIAVLKVLDRIEFLSDNSRLTESTSATIDHLSEILKPNKSMVFKKILTLSACLYLVLAFADLEKVEYRSKCRPTTIVCPCTDENGVQLNVTVKTCLVNHLTGKKSVCDEEAILTKCKRGKVVNFQ